MLRPILFASLAILIAAVAASVAWFHSRLPPNCTDPGTIALVRQTLVANDDLPSTVTLQGIRTVAGGPVALRFVCQAEVGGFDPHKLPPGMPIPGVVHYTSQLTPDRKHHEVSVDLEPLLKWVQVQ